MTPNWAAYPDGGPDSSAKADNFLLRAGSFPPARTRFHQSVFKQPREHCDSRNESGALDLAVARLDDLVAWQPFYPLPSVPMTKDTSQATKADLEVLLGHIQQRIDDSEERVKRHVDVRHEQLVHDFKGIFKDRLEQHDDRLTRLERMVGISR